MNIYFDTCALNRLTDNQQQARVRDEAEAVSQLLDRVTAGEFRWIASNALRDELSKNPNALNRSIALAFLSLASHSRITTVTISARASQLQAQGLGGFDATHLALAEAADVQCLFTVDDRFLKLTATQAKPKVVNPLEWLRRRSLWLVRP